MISEEDLLSADISFDPPLYNKRAKKHQVYLIAYQGGIVKGRLKGITITRTFDKILGSRIIVIEVPTVLTYDNRPEIDLPDFPLSDRTRESLQYRVRDAFEVEIRRILQS